MKHYNDQYYNGNKLRDVGAPSLGTDAANKTYVDQSIAGLDLQCPSVACETAASTQAKVGKCKDFSLNNPCYVFVNIKNANSYDGKITLNINSTGAKDVYINGTVSSSTNKTLPAGTYIVYYNGQYHFRTDGKLNINGVTFGGSYNDLTNRPSLATVATSGSYNDLTNKPTIPAAQVNSDWNATSGVAKILNKPSLATVATSGSYNDLSNKPTIPAAQVQTDWNATTGMGVLLNKPNLAAVATSGSYNDLSNKPTIPTVPTNVSSFTNDAGYITVSGVPSEVLWCSYDSNTNSVSGLTVAQIIAAKNNNQIVCCKYGNTILSCTVANSSMIIFSCVNCSVVTAQSSSRIAEKIITFLVYSSTTQSWIYKDVTVQEQLVGSGSGQNIKTVNNQSLIGSGNISIPTGENNVQSDWNVTDTSSDAYIKNKPTIPTKVSQLTNDSGYTTNTGTVTQVKVGSTAYNPSSGIVSLPAYPTTLPASDVYAWAKASTKPSYSWSEITNKPTFATVATSGSYNDLSNKPTIPTVPTSLSSFTNDTNFITLSDVPSELFVCTCSTSNNVTTVNKTASEIATAFAANKIVICKDTANTCIYICNKANSSYIEFTCPRPTVPECFWYLTYYNNSWTKGAFYFQEKLSSGTNIKTINGTSILGSGDISIPSGDDNVQSDWNQTNTSADDYIKNKPTIPTKVSQLTNDSGYTTNTGTVTQVKVGTTAYNPSSGVISLPAYPSDYYSSSTSRTANTVLAAPNGSNGAATFRALVAADIPSITKSKISDFPSSMPASDVYSWAKASTKPSYAWSEITNKPTVLSDHDFTHTANTTVSTSTKTITYAAGTRGSQMISISADLALTFAVNNLSDNYLWIKNTGSSEVDITISAVTKSGGTNVSNVYLPSDGISIPAGKVCEIGIVVNADGAFITSRSDLSL